MRSLWAKLTSSMKWAGTSSPASSLRKPVSMGWLSSTRTWTRSPSSLVRTRIAVSMSAAAAADRDLDLARRVVEPAVRSRQRVYVAGLRHLHARLQPWQCAGRNAEVSGEDVRVFLDQ